MHSQNEEDLSFGSGGHQSLSGAGDRPVLNKRAGIDPSHTPPQTKPNVVPASTNTWVLFVKDAAAWSVLSNCHCGGAQEGRCTIECGWGSSVMRYVRNVVRPHMTWV